MGRGEGAVVTGMRWHDSGEREFSIEGNIPPSPPFSDLFILKDLGFADFGSCTF
jgi:hypothetical protein